MNPRTREEGLMPQDELVLTQPEPIAQVRSPFDLLSLALKEKAAIDVIERLSALQERAMDRDAEMQFNQQLAQCQRETSLIVNDSVKTGPGGKQWATYKALDKAIRPIYLRHGFSVSFGSAECSIPGHIMVTCHLSSGGHTRLYQLPMDASGEGPKGGGAMSKPHAILAAMEYGRRCLLKSIFNLVTGEEDKLLTNGWIAEQVGEIERCETQEGLREAFQKASTIALEARDINAYTAIKEAKDKRKAAL